MKKIIIISTLILLIPFKQLLSQSNEVCGFIIHYFDKTPVAGATVYIENTIATTTTDAAGAFCLNLTSDENKILIEKDGYFQTYIMAGKNAFLNIQMVKLLEQDAAIAKGISIDEIKTINVTNKKEGIAYNKGFYADDAGYSKMMSKVKTTSASSSSRVRGKKMSGAATLSSPAAPMGAPGADAAPRAKPSPAPVKMSFSEESTEFEAMEISEEIVVKGLPSKRVKPDVLLDKLPERKIKAGRLTAGEIHDFSKWEMWNDLGENELKTYKDKWKISPENRYTIQAINEKGFPIVDADIELQQGNKIVWKAKTDNTGKAELWHLLFEDDSLGKKVSEPLKMLIKHKGIENTISTLTPFSKGINTITLKEACNYSKELDIAFVVDATGSMGDEIDYLKVELLDVIDRVKNKFDGLNIRLGNVFYRDEGEAYVTKKSPLTHVVKASVSFIKAQKAAGGGDFPEAVDKGLDVAINELEWSSKAVARIAFLVLDASPHDRPEVKERLQKTIANAAEKGIRIVPVVGSGIDKGTEYLLRSFALATNGHYIFLTDHSGIGGKHLAPSTDSYNVKNLNDLLVDIIERYVKVEDCNQQGEPQLIEPKPNALVSVFPNPNNGQFIVKTGKDLEELFITDSNGKILVRFTEFTTGENQVDIGNFPNGVYYVRYQLDEKVVTEKVIVKR